MRFAILAAAALLATPLAVQAQPGATSQTPQSPSNPAKGGVSDPPGQTGHRGADGMAATNADMGQSTTAPNSGSPTYQEPSSTHSTMHDQHMGTHKDKKAKGEATQR